MCAKIVIYHYPLSFQLLLQGVELRRGEELSQGDLQPIAQLFDGDDGNILPALVQHAVYGGRCDSGQVCQLIGLDFPLAADLQKTVHHRLLYYHIKLTYNKTISKGVVLLILLSSKIGYTAGVATCGIIRSSTVDLYLYSYSETVLR